MLIVDDHPLLTVGLTTQLRGYDVDATGCTTHDDAIELATSGIGFDLIVLDLELPGVPDPTALIAKLHRTIRSPIVMLSGSDDAQRLAECLEAGAVAVLDKAEPLLDIVADIVALAEGRPIRINDATRRLEALRGHRQAQDEKLRPFTALTEREAAVLGRLQRGMSPKEISQESFVAVSTVRTHIKNILRKLNVGSQLEAVALANSSGWTPPDSHEHHDHP